MKIGFANKISRNTTGHKEIGQAQLKDSAAKSVERARASVHASKDNCFDLAAAKNQLRQALMFADYVRKMK